MNNDSHREDTSVPRVFLRWKHCELTIGENHHSKQLIPVLLNINEITVLRGEKLNYKNEKVETVKWTLFLPSSVLSPPSINTAKTRRTPPPSQEEKSTEVDFPRVDAN